MNQVIIIYRVENRQVGVAPADSEAVINLPGITVTDGSNDSIGEAVGERGVNTFQVGAAFKEVGVNQIHVYRVLFDMLPVGSRFPGVLFGSLQPNAPMNYHFGTKAALTKAGNASIPAAAEMPSGT